MLEDTKHFNGTFEEKCQEKSVPSLLLALVNMLLEGSSIKDQINACSTPATLSIAQIIKYNCVKHMRTQTNKSSFVRHCTSQEPTSSFLHWTDVACTNSEERSGGQDVQSRDQYLS